MVTKTELWKLDGRVDSRGNPVNRIDPTGLAPDRFETLEISWDGAVGLANYLWGGVKRAAQYVADTLPAVAAGVASHDEDLAAAHIEGYERTGNPVAEGYQNWSNDTFGPDNLMQAAGAGTTDAVAVGMMARGAVQVARELPYTIAPRYMLQRVVNKVSAELVANPASAKSLLSRKEYFSGQRSPRTFPLNYGKAMERGVAKTIRESATLSKYYKHIGGPNSPDFIGLNLLEGRTFELTTFRAMSAHMGRPYIDAFILYKRPLTLKVLP